MVPLHLYDQRYCGKEQAVEKLRKAHVHIGVLSREAARGIELVYKSKF